MLAALLAAALLQSAGTAGTSAAADTTPAAATADSAPRRVRRVALTAEHLRTAFTDAGARELLAVARAARTRQDTALTAYDATTYQRVSVGLGIRRFGRDRLLYRSEIASRVRWRRGAGAVVDVLGSRQATPSGGRDVRMRITADGGEIGPIPYHPGQETLWFGTDEVETEINELDGPVHPLANGAEAYYTYARGDSVTLRLGPNRTIRLRELRVRPRQPRWNLSVGSLWFDADNAQLVRAVFRLAVPLEIWDVVEEVDEDEARDDDDDPPAWVKAMMNPMRATINAVTVEYGLEGGGFWLPRLQALDAEVEAAFARVPIRLEQRFQYASVNGTLDSMPDVPPPPTAEERRARAVADSAWRDSLRAMTPAQRASAREARAEATAGEIAIDVGGGRRDSTRRRPSVCDTATVRTRVTTRFDGGLSVLTRTPCDEEQLVGSPALPPSIYDDGDTAFDARMEQALREAALSLDAQAEWSPQLPTVKYGLGDGLLRYNRIEGLSPAVRVDAALGRGYAARLQARIGTADLEPNAELQVMRAGGDRTYHVAAYRRLGVANDWGEPLGLSSSLSALLFGRDDGFYFRTWGVEVGAVGSGAGFAGGDLQWRLFSERHDVAEPETRWALFDRMRATNIVAEEGSVTGVGTRFVRTVGLDPGRTRWLVDVRGEGGVGSFGFGRLFGDVTVSRPLLANVDGALTLGAGSSVGAVPAQRQFYLGGPFTVRGQDPGAGIGDAYWLARAELGRATVGWRPVVFADLGWAGARGAWREPGRPLSGVGAGLSILDGLLRLDVSRGIHPERQWRFDSYFEARF